jgi:hypothetical protein
MRRVKNSRFAAKGLVTKLDQGRRGSQPKAGRKVHDSG